jgi:hypothetical protein
MNEWKENSRERKIQRQIGEIKKKPAKNSRNKPWKLIAYPKPEYLEEVKRNEGFGFWITPNVLGSYEKESQAIQGLEDHLRKSYICRPETHEIKIENRKK